MNNNIDKLKQALDYSKIILNTMNITGVENCGKILTVYNNLDAILKMLETGELALTEQKPPEENK